MAQPFDAGAKRWRPRFSLRTLVLAILAYGSLWSATEVYGGRAFRCRIEARTERLQRATAAWGALRTQEATFWQEEGYFFPGEEQAAVAPASAEPDAVGRVLPVEGDPARAQVTVWCDVETIAVAPFMLHVQYTCFCTDAYGRSLPLGEDGAIVPTGRGYVFWCFGLGG